MTDKHSDHSHPKKKVTGCFPIILALIAGLGAYIGINSGALGFMPPTLYQVLGSGGVSLLVWSLTKIKSFWTGVTLTLTLFGTIFILMAVKSGIWLHLVTGSISIVLSLLIIIFRRRKRRHGSHETSHH